MKAVQDAIRKACFSEDGVNEIKQLKDTFAEELDLSFDDNFALRTAVERNDFILASYLLTDENVIQQEANADFPCLRLAIEQKSPIVQFFLVGVNFIETEIKIPADLVRMANELKRREKEKLNEPKSSTETPVSLTAFSSFKSKSAVNFRASFASAREEATPRKGFLKFLLCS